MKLIFIRHGDPDYENDTLTQKGFREAKLLADRVSGWNNITDLYCSPLGRAKDTASQTLERLGREASVCDWLREFSAVVEHPLTGEKQIPWDFLPSFWTAQEDMYDRHNFAQTPVMKTGDVEAEFVRVCAGLDALLKRYGYIRDGRYYRVVKETRSTDREPVVVLFCHMGITLYLLGYLLGISPVVLTSGFFLAPTSVTVLGTEEREENTASFRVQMAGDTSHLRAGGEPVSYMGYFTDPFQG